MKAAISIVVAVVMPLGSSYSLTSFWAACWRDAAKGNAPVVKAPGFRLPRYFPSLAGNGNLVCS
jgi:hypothetical protein